MQMTNSENSYGLIAKAFHWIIGILMIGLLFVGIMMSGLDPSPTKWEIYGLHKALGILVLALVIPRIIWKHIAGKPNPIETHQPWERILSKIIHVLLYLGIIGMPLSGWVMSSAGGHPVSFFGLFELPALVEKNKVIGGIAHEIHEIAGFALIGAILLHFAGAAKHHILDKDSTLNRMLFKNWLAGTILLVILGLAALSPIGASIQKNIAKAEKENAAAATETTDSQAAAE